MIGVFKIFADSRGTREFTAEKEEVKKKKKKEYIFSVHKLGDSLLFFLRWDPNKSCASKRRNALNVVGSGENKAHFIK
eukprot:gene10697-7430_t